MKTKIKNFIAFLVGIFLGITIVVAIPILFLYVLDIYYGDIIFKSYDFNSTIIKRPENENLKLQILLNSEIGFNNMDLEIYFLNFDKNITTYSFKIYDANTNKTIYVFTDIKSKSDLKFKNLNFENKTYIAEIKLFANNNDAYNYKFILHPSYSETRYSRYEFITSQ
ncbi:hypothetical protein [Campylobacter ureolyticus]|uniref:Uncharacterized protein n=1 Tax=Campylobacter ureolyticus TaxID=827 RepID=A0AAE7EBB8_9BACT|nr:hypothetical protein [Campylobacter ureolyticus]MCR8685681.1 hypothetical protein [Campylobacter ureolyticus]QKF85083.1 hypothetical protein CURT_1655 [Campylobacter ureolyticus]QQY36435.1 hypothetical protein I6I59_04205 [Campylobacter ureolyticus]SUX25629.1 Uncharacterised protein [Campylobacter ureolyticus]